MLDNFITEAKLPKNMISGRGSVWKSTLTGIDEIEWISVEPRTNIRFHGHEANSEHENQWEVLIQFSIQTVYVCLIGEKHELKNKSGIMQMFLSIKGHNNYIFDDFQKFFSKFGFTVLHGSVYFNN